MGDRTKNDVEQSLPGAPSGDETPATTVVPIPDNWDELDEDQKYQVAASILKQLARGAGIRPSGAGSDDDR